MREKQLETKSADAKKPNQKQADANTKRNRAARRKKIRALTKKPKVVKNAE